MYSTYKYHSGQHIYKCMVPLNIKKQKPHLLVCIYPELEPLAVWMLSRGHAQSKRKSKGPLIIPPVKLEEIYTRTVQFLLQNKSTVSYRSIVLFIMNLLLIMLISFELHCCWSAIQLWILTYPGKIDIG